MGQTLTAVADRLTDLSRQRFMDPYQRVGWPPVLDPTDWQFAPELMAGWGLPAVAELSPEAQKKLSLCEALNLFSINIHGEKLLLQGLARRLHEPRFRQVSGYLQHFIDEENRHLHWFGEFCRRYGRIYPSRHIALAAEPLPEGAEDFLFFARILVFEEIVDAYNARLGRDERLSPTARLINRLHHEDEVRHRAFGRHLVRQLWVDGVKDWPQAVPSALGQRLGAWLQAVWRGFYNPDVYRDAGLSQPHALIRAAWDAPAARALRHAVTTPVTGFLERIGAFAHEVAA